MKNLAWLLIVLFCAPYSQSQVHTQVQHNELHLAIGFFRNNDFERALPLFESLFNRDPSHIHFHYYFHSLIETRDCRAAEKAARRMIRNNPGQLQYQIDLGFAHLCAGEVSKAKKVYESVIESLPADRRIIVETANNFWIRREPELAIKTYLRGRELLGSNHIFNVELGDLYERTGNFQGSISEFLTLLETSPGNIGIIQARIQHALTFDTQGERAQQVRTALLRKIRQFPDALVFSEMMLWFAIQQNDFENAYQQAIALDRRLNENGNRVYSLARLSAANQQFDIARKAYEYVIGKGAATFLYTQARIELLQLDYMLLTANEYPTQEELTVLEMQFREALNDLGTNRTTVALVQYLARLLAFYQHNAPDAISLLHQALDLPGIDPRVLADCKLDLADIYLYSGEVWEAILLYAQVERIFPNDPMGHESKFRNARLWYMIGEFEWASTQLEVLKAGTSQLIANDAMALWLLINDNKENDTTFEALSFFARADMHRFRNRDDLALLTLDSLMQLFPNHSIIGHTLMKKAAIMEKRQEYNEAARLLEIVTDAFGFGLLADQALFRLAELYAERLNNTGKAMQLYKRLLVEFPASIYATPARTKFRLLRGDPL